MAPSPLLTLLTALLLLAGCGTTGQQTAMRGANLMQANGIAWDSPQAHASLAQLRATGATWVAFVPFLRQPDPQRCALAAPDPAELDALRTAIATAHGLGLRVALKPQVLVERTWAGEVAMPDAAAWACWFAAYGRALGHYARLATMEGVELLVAGTELKRTESRPEWRDILHALRRDYAGSISYVFHLPEDASRFAALAELDSVGYSLYPRLGSDPARIEQRIEDYVADLRRFSNELGKPVWIAEVGMPSRRNAGEAPWAWEAPAGQASMADPDFQARAIDAWLVALDGDWHRGTLIWAWLSDPAAGGPGDTGFTPQNKPAMARLACRWAGRCEGS